jgi:hypothetical protein
MTEAELKREVLRLAYRHGWHVFHMPADTLRGSQGRGYPDLTLARNGYVLWAELKQEKGTVTEEQRSWHEALPKGRARVIRPSDLDWLEDWLR